MPTRYYFFHIPKTAGTSVTAWLEQCGRFTVFPEHLWSRLLAWPRAELADYDLFRGHFYRGLHRYLDVPLTPFVFLRNPIDRSISHWEHIRRSPDHYFHDRVVAQGSFRAFLEDETTRRVIENYQVRSLCNAVDPVALDARLPARRGVHDLERALETADLGFDDRTALAVAQDYLTRCCVVGITERMEDSLARLAGVLQVSPPERAPSLNVATGRQIDALTLSAEDLAALAPLIEVDWALYHQALHRFDAALRMPGRADAGDHGDHPSPGDGGGAETSSAQPGRVARWVSRVRGTP